jgi:hypothetical protein
MRTTLSVGNLTIHRLVEQEEPLFDAHAFFPGLTPEMMAENRSRWVPTFLKAKYVFADRELAFWTERHKQAPEACPWINDSVLPIVEARRTEIVKSDNFARRAI